MKRRTFKYLPTAFLLAATLFSHAMKEENSHLSREFGSEQDLRRVCERGRLRKCKSEKDLWTIRFQGCCKRFRSEEDLQRTRAQRYLRPRGKKALVESCDLECCCFHNAVVTGIPAQWTKEETLIFIVSENFSLQDFSKGFVLLEQNGLRDSKNYQLVICSVTSSSVCPRGHCALALAIRTEAQRKYALFPTLKEMVRRLDPESLSAYIEFMY
jgi:hypothetical protein